MQPSAYGPFPYSPIIRRPRLEWPKGARVAFWVIPNIEFFSLEERPGGHGGGKIPDVMLWSERDYGNRVGVWRLMEVLDRYDIRATVALNSAVCRHHPAIIEEGEKRRWEWMGHNETNTRRLNEAPPGEEAAHHPRRARRNRARTGRRPVGWLGAGLQETWETLDLLAAEGIEYVGDWCNDDQPYVMTLAGGRSIIAMPYNTEINDKPAFETLHRTRRRVPRDDLPPVRRALPRGRAIGPGDGDRAPSLSQRPALSHRRARPRARLHLPP